MNMVFSSSPAPVLSAVLVRQLGPDDLLERSAAESLGVSAKPLKEIRAVHHRIAELLASGFKPVEVGRIVGYSQSRLSILRENPAFEELIAFYAGAHQVARVSDIERLTTLSRSAVEVLQERLETEPEKINVDNLVKIASFGADRVGLGPTTKSISTVAVLSSQDLQELKSQAQTHGVTIISPEDRRAAASLVIDGGTEPPQDSQAERITYSPQERPGVREEGSEGA